MCPQYLKGVCIRTLGGHPPPVDVVVLKEFLGPTLKVVILHESDTPAGRKELVICLDVHVHLGIHDSMQTFVLPFQLIPAQM